MAQNFGFSQYILCMYVCTIFLSTLEATKVVYTCMYTHTVYSKIYTSADMHTCALHTQYILVVVHYKEVSLSEGLSTQCVSVPKDGKLSFITPPLLPRGLVSM